MQPHITAGEVLEMARRELETVRARGGAVAEPWKTASVGEPLLVRTVEHLPSFWIVPVLLGERVLGTIEIGLQGEVRGESFFYSSPDAVKHCPAVATRISGAEARLLAAPFINRHVEAEISEPAYVEDERGRLAWMIEIRRGGELLSRIFATPGYAWEWKPGGPPPAPGVRG